MKLSLDVLLYNLERDLSHFPNDFAAEALRTNLLKKLVSEVADDADELALGKMVAANSDCQNWSLNYERMLDEYLIGEFRQLVDKFLMGPQGSILQSAGKILTYGNVGPGASVGARGYDFYTKLFDSTLSTTSTALYRNFRHHCTHDPRWALAESFRMSKHGECSVVEGSTIAFVPKTNDISRVICIEPSVNMYWQLGIGNIITAELRKQFGLRIRKDPLDEYDQQHVNRELARRGSITGELSTIDLSSASDSVSLGMLRELFPADFLGWLLATRSPFAKLPSGELLELHMVSSMGNGFTFPLETLIFSCVVHAAYRLMNIEPVSGISGNWGVFGDDIICRTEATGLVMRLLTLLGFKVNWTKSFTIGPFRESCGGDFLKGKDVRPVHIKDLSTVPSRFVAINRLQRWSAIQAIPLVHTISYLRKHVPNNYVPLFENDDAGIKVPLGYFAPGAKYAEDLYMYKPYRVRAQRLVVKDTLVIHPRGQRKRFFNPEALLLSFLRGDVSGGCISLRSRHTCYTNARTSVTSSWNELSRDLIEVGLARLKNVAYLNLRC